MPVSPWLCFLKRAQVRRRRRSSPLGPEPLEDRCLLTNFTEFAIPTASSGPGAITRGPDGNLWFTEKTATKIGRIATSGTITEFPLPHANAGVTDIAAGPDGNLWFTEFDGNKVGRITPTGTITEFAIPSGGSRPGPITAGADGNVWFAENNAGADKVSRITPTGQVTEFDRDDFKTITGITAGPDGNVWYSEISGDNNGLGRVTPSGSITEFELPDQRTTADITAAPDGNLWFVEGAGGKLGRFSTLGNLTEFGFPTQPDHLTVGPDGNLWFSAGSLLGRVTATGAVTTVPYPGTAGAGNLTTGPDGCLWFTEPSTNKIAALNLISATASTLRPRINQTFSDTVAQFTDLDPAAKASDFTASINWGDGTSSSFGVIGGSGATGFSVTGTHTYTQAAVALASITITNVNAPSSMPASTAAAGALVFLNRSTHLVFLQQPLSAKAANKLLATVTVAVEDSNNQVVIGDTSTVTLSLGNNPVGGNLVGTLSVQAIKGIATFNDWVLKQAGYGYTLVATALPLAGATSLPFNLSGDTTSSSFGISSDVPLIGNWTGDGRSKIGVYRPGTSTFFLDLNGDGKFTGAPLDATYQFGSNGDVPLVGDWSGDGRDEIGVWRPSNATFILDRSGNGRFDGTLIDPVFSFGIGSDTPLVGDWNGDGRTKVGVYRPGTSTFFLDTNDNGHFDSATDLQAQFGINGDVPVVGDWTGSGLTKIGVWRSSSATFFLDLDGEGHFDSTIDAQDQFGIGSDMPVVGDWTGDGRTKIGVWRSSTATFLLDRNGNGHWDGLAVDAQDTFGSSSDVPVLGDWNGDGRTKIGTRRTSTATFYLDLNGNGRYEAPPP